MKVMMIKWSSQGCLNEMLIWLCKMRILRHYARMHTRTWGSKNRTFEHLRWITSFETWRYRGVRNVLRKRYRTSIEQQSDTSRTAIEYKPNDNRIPIEHDLDTNHTSERWYIELPKRSGDYERISRELWKNIQRVVKEYPRRYIRISKKLGKATEKSAFEYLKMTFKPSGNLLPSLYWSDGGRMIEKRNLWGFLRKEAPEISVYYMSCANL